MIFQNLSHVEIKYEELHQFLDLGNGRETTETQCRSRRVNSQFVLSISFKVRSYVADGIRLAHVGYAPGGTWRGILAGNAPIQTYGVWMNFVKNPRISALHPVCSLCQDINHKLLVHRCPSSHPSVCVHDRLDVVLDVFLLSALIV